MNYGRYIELVNQSTYASELTMVYCMVDTSMSIVDGLYKATQNWWGTTLWFDVDVD